MKKFEFHLEKLLSYKDQILDSELMTLAVLNSHLSDQQQKLFSLQKEREQCRSEFENKMLEKTMPATCRMYIFYDEHIKEQIMQTEKAIENIYAQIDKQTELIKKLKLETKSLETLKTTRFDEYKKESLKVSERQIEEFVSTTRLLKMTV
ncbi:MAG: flagellar export protein FliJ [Eubacteriales bacterium]|nr:flagellar export protein FliJ [Eubacteriales bacterium]